MSMYDDPNREAVGLAPIWTGADGGEVPPPEGEEGPFDPSAHTVDEVNAYLAEHPEDTDRVLQAEEAGKARTGILGS